MIIISWDVGVINLAFCVLEYYYDTVNRKPMINIIDWDIINLIEDDRIKLNCCGNMKAKKGETPKICGKKATYCLNIKHKNKSYGFCKTHLSQHNEYWSNNDTKRLFGQTKLVHKCNYIKRGGEECGKNGKYIYQCDNKKYYYCRPHYNSELKNNIKKFSPQLIKNLIVKKYPTSKLQLSLITKLDELSKHFAKLGIEEVIIENQPSQKNPKMKSIANTLFDYFMIRGYVDKIHNMDIQLVRFICPSNKLKVNNDNTIEVFKANKDSKKKYKLTKALGIQYTKQLNKNDEAQLEYLDLYTKQDDICDAYLQGRYYLEFIRNKQDSIPIKVKKAIKKKKITKPRRKNSGSKTSKPKKKIIESAKKIYKSKTDVVISL